MPALLYLSEGVQYRITLGCVDIVVLQTLHKHARVDPRERAAELRHVPSVTHFAVEQHDSRLTHRIGVPEASMTTARNGL